MEKQLDLINPKFPHLTVDGMEITDSTPHSVRLEFRHLTLEEQINRFDRLSELRRQFQLRELDLGEDDFDLDDLPPEGLSEGELFFLRRGSNADDSGEEEASAAAPPQEAEGEASGSD